MPLLTMTLTGAGALPLLHATAKTATGTMIAASHDRLLRKGVIK
ncbi:hypothetical protein I546_1833 [Mycobacterium kansasii 732]|nr:hypothetical protein I546_1833 [Mycobacterium kansasii 732]